MMKYITKGALLARLRRALAKDSQILRVTRGQRWRSDLGDYYRVDANHNAIVGTWVDPVQLGRELP